eukprot:4256110-Pleurochrysis_carterae.AAC.2
MHRRHLDKRVSGRSVRTALRTLERTLARRLAALHALRPQLAANPAPDNLLRELNRLVNRRLCRLETIQTI